MKMLLDLIVVFGLSILWGTFCAGVGLFTAQLLAAGLGGCIIGTVVGLMRRRWEV